jgi:hypothetical protein
MANEDASSRPQPPQPDAALKALERLLGTWRVAGGAEGQVSYKWLEGGFFLVQHVDLEQDGQRTKGVEIIGRERKFGEATPSEDIKSRYYDDQGNTFDYVYDLEGDTLTIWGGERGSPAYFRGEFSAEGNTLTGGWVYPGGGGYDSTMIRVR